MIPTRSGGQSTRIVQITDDPFKAVPTMTLPLARDVVDRDCARRIPTVRFITPLDMLKSASPEAKTPPPVSIPIQK